MREKTATSNSLGASLRDALSVVLTRAGPASLEPHPCGVVRPLATVPGPCGLTPPRLAAPHFTSPRLASPRLRA